MERVYLVRAGGGELRLIYGTDAAPDGDIVGLTPDLSAASIDRWHEKRRTRTGSWRPPGHGRMPRPATAVPCGGTW
jgi:hypothetical protein